MSGSGIEVLLSADQVCAQLAGCSKRKLRRLVDEGRLKPRPFGSNTIYVQSEVQALIRSIAEQPPGRAKFRGVRKGSGQ